jgi:hypothetical protein
VKITDVSVTMFHWKSEAWRTASGAFGGHRVLGVVTVHTDAGIDGYAFLGSSRQGAEWRTAMKTPCESVVPSKPWSTSGTKIHLWKKTCVTTPRPESRSF